MASENSEILKNISDSDAEKGQNNENAIPKNLTALHGAALIIGAIVGSGIFTNPGRIYQLFGNAYIAMTWWVVGAIVAYCGAMTYGEWACRVPKSGGDAPYLEKAFSKPKNLLAFMYSICRCFFMNPGYNVSTALVFMEYLLNCIPRYQRVIGADSLAASEIATDTEYSIVHYFGGCALLLVHSILCSVSNESGAKALQIFTMLAVGSVSIMAFTAFLLPLGAFPNVKYSKMFSIGSTESGSSAPDSLKDTSSEANPNEMATSLWRKLSSGLVLSLWAYDGWSNLASSVGEMRNPKKGIRIANLIGIGFVATVFILCNISYFYVVEKEFFNKDMPIYWAEELIGKNVGKYVICVIVMLCTLSCSFTSVFSASRIAQATAASNNIVFNPFFARLSSRTQTPLNSIWVNFFLSCVYMTPVFFSADAFTIVITVVSNNFWFFSALTSIGLLKEKYDDGTIFNFRDSGKYSVEVLFLSPTIVALAGVIITILGFLEEAESAPWYLKPYMLSTYSVLLLVFSAALFYCRVGYQRNRN